MTEEEATVDMEGAGPTLHLFEGYGIELEYMIVGVDTLDALPIADAVLTDATGAVASEVEHGFTAWSNELVLHVIELKTNGPAESLDGLPKLFLADVGQIQRLLLDKGGQLLPTAMHPWFVPERDAKLWPYEHGPIYETFNHIFDCKGHGWSNLQSTHLNLPFSGDDELGKLHAAVRLVLPLLPGIAASSPYVEGKATGILDNRLHYYRNNSRRVPSVSGHIIPEQVFTEAAYRDLLNRIYRDLRPLDPRGILLHEWVNARGAIARFDRNAIEIRVLDVQETPEADLAIAALIVAVLKELCGERFCSETTQRGFAVEPLETIFLSTMLEAEAATISDRPYLDALGFPAGHRATAGEVWHHLYELTLKTGSLHRRFAPTLSKILHKGTLARRIIRTVGPDVKKERLVEVYRELGACLGEGRLFEG